MIKSFADKDTEALFRRWPHKRLPHVLQRRALRKLDQLDDAAALADLAVPPGNRLERLKGDRQGQHSIRINERWRICFRWEKGGAWDVEITDYH